MGEHSPCDALIPSILGDYCVQEPMCMNEFEDEPRTIQNCQKIEWVVDEHIKSECARVGEQALISIEDSDESELWFEDYGVDWMRSGEATGCCSRRG